MKPFPKIHATVAVNDDILTTRQSQEGTLGWEVCRPTTLQECFGHGKTTIPTRIRMPTRIHTRTRTQTHTPIQTQIHTQIHTIGDGPRQLRSHVSTILCGIGLSRLLPRQCLLRSEEHTSELQSLMRISYAVFCLKKKKTH